MATSDPRQAEGERAVFAAFLTAYHSFAGQVKTSRQPDDEFPDVAVTLMDGAEVDFELG
jgi:hypothetical protein